MRRSRSPGAARARAAGAGLALLAASSLLVAEEVPILASSTLRAIDARSAALLVSGQQGGDLELRLLAFGTPGAGTAPGAIELVLDVHAAALAPAEEQERVPLLVYFYALDPRGRVLGTVKQGIALDGVALTAPWRAGVKFVGRIELPPGDYTVRALAVRRDTGAFGLVHGAASVPASDTAAPAAFALELASRWLVVAPGGSAGAGTLLTPALGPGWVPATRPVVAPGEAAPLRLALRDAHPDEGWRGRIAGAAEAALDLRPDSTGDGAWRAWQATLGLPTPGFGEYRIELVAPGAREPALALPLAVAAGEAATKPEGGPLWTDLVAGGAPSAELALPEPGPRREVPLEELERAYLDAIGRLAAGEESQALAALLAAEPATIAGESGERHQELLRAQLQIAGDLASIDLESLPPLVRLHELTYVAYLARHSPALASRARRLATRLALGYAKQRDAPETRAVAARALESLAGRVLVGGGMVEAARLYADAVELDARSVAGLRGLGYLLERGAEYRDAARYFRRAADSDPADAEVRLHLAVNLARAGAGAEAESVLRACLEAGAPDWVRTVAAEELSRALDARGRRDDAIALLAEELARREEPGLMIQLAALHDAAGRRREARELLERLDAAELSDVDSPRLQYARSDFPALFRAIDVFGEAARERLPKLADAHRKLERKLGAL